MYPAYCYYCRFFNLDINELVQGLPKFIHVDYSKFPRLKMDCKLFSFTRKPMKVIDFKCFVELPEHIKTPEHTESE